MKSKIIFFSTVTALLSSFLLVAPASAATAKTRPSQPRNVTAVAGNDSATVRFLPPTHDGGYRILRYDVQIESPSAKRVTTCASTNCHIAGLTSGTFYFFEVAAVTKLGRGAYSTPSKVITPTNSITISFNANGGTGTMASESEPLNTLAALTPNSFTYSGHTFAGWNAQANGSGVEFADGTTVQFAFTATLYAQWTVTPPSTEATITFNANGGTGTMAPETENLNAATPLTTNSFTRNSFSFAGWNTSAQGSGTSYGDGASYSFATSITLYAQWTVDTGSFPGQASSNWSGYAVTTTSIVTLASGEWTVPTLNCAATPNGEAGTWVGTGGDDNGSDALLQTGVNELCVDGTQVNEGFWEIFPATPNHSESFFDFPVSAGDTIIATVGYVNSQWVTVLEDQNTGLSGVFTAGGVWEVVTTSTGAVVGGVQGNASGYSYAGGYSAEWIQEDVTSASSGALFQFPDYGSVTFTDLRISPAVPSLPDSDGLEIIDDNGDPLSVPGPYNGTEFTITYAAP